MMTAPASEIPTAGCRQMCILTMHLWLKDMDIMILGSYHLTVTRALRICFSCHPQRKKK